MKPEKLTIEHLAAYLPYGLKGVGKKSEFIIVGAHDCLIFGDNEYGELEEYYEDVKLILRPLSDLIEEIEHNGEKFVFSDRYLSNSKLLMLLDNSLCSFNNPLNDVDYSSIKILLKHHFDVFGLIDANLAIDINTLEENK